jgi:very-short-patch-repair endonuclease
VHTHRTAPEYVIQLAQQFRKEPTEPEAFLWECLRDRRLYGYKFRRQHPIGRYIADFFCSEVSLVVELDGKVHNKPDRKIYDRIRDEELTLRGLNILHIKNEELIEDPEKTLLIIIAFFPSPHGRGGRR